MPAQYDKLQVPYDIVRSSSISLLEHDHVRSVIAPYIRGARVLDLACGTGYYTYSFLEWGAHAVLGVDISSGMLDGARRRKPAGVEVRMADDADADADTGVQNGVVATPPSPPDSEDSPAAAKAGTDSPPVTLLRADIMKPTVYPGGPYDIVFGAWFLNYAPDRATLESLFRNIALNLRPGGRFIAVTLPPDPSPPTVMEAQLAVRPPPKGSGGLYFRVLHAVPDGVCFHGHAHTEVGDVAFQAYHLSAAAHEECAREAGLRGDWSWGLTEVSDHWLQGDVEGGASREEMQSYAKVPWHGLLMVEK